MRPPPSLFALALLLPAVPAQKLSLRSDGPRGQVEVEARVTATPPGRVGGYGWLTVALRNCSRRPHDVRIEVLRADLGHEDGDPLVTATRRVAADAEVTATLPLPGLAASVTTSLRADGLACYDLLQPIALASVDAGPAVLLVAADGDARSRVSALLRAAARAGRRQAGRDASHEDVEPVSRAASELPDRWTRLTGFDLVIADGRDEGLDPERQTLLLRWAAAGGTLLVVDADALEPGPLTAEPPAVVGFGAVRVLAGDGGLRSGRFDPELVRWLGTRSPGERRHGVLAERWRQDLPIPGIAEVDRRVLFVLILGFVVVAGPVNLWFVRRQRRPMLLLVTLPAVAAVFTGGILGYGLLAEGLGIAGAVESVTLLDQQRGEAVTLARRTLYAGIAPRALAPGAQTWLFSAAWTADPSPIEATWRHQNRTHALHIDLDREVLDGAALPSRTPTTLASLGIDAVPQRLRFRREGDGYRCQHDGPLRPDAGPGTLVLCDFEARFFLAGADGGLRAVSEAEAQLVASSLVGELPAAALQLAPGRYLALVPAPPALDPLGLVVEVRSGRHLVLGKLAPEDVGQ